MKPPAQPAARTLCKRGRKNSRSANFSGLFKLVFISSDLSCLPLCTRRPTPAEQNFDAFESQILKPTEGKHPQALICHYHSTPSARARHLKFLPSVTFKIITFLTFLSFSPSVSRAQNSLATRLATVTSLSQPERDFFRDSCHCACQQQYLFSLCSPSPLVDSHHGVSSPSQRPCRSPSALQRPARRSSPSLESHKRSPQSHRRHRGPKLGSRH